MPLATTKGGDSVLIKHTQLIKEGSSSCGWIAAEQQADWK
jgi:hypothetical protein